MKQGECTMKEPKVLIVESVNANSIREYLKSSYEILSTNAEQTFETVVESSPDMIILDIIIHFEVCHKLKTEKETEGIPIIFVTNNGDNHTGQGLEFKCVAQIILPIEKDALLSRLSNVLSEYNERLAYKLANEQQLAALVSRSAALASRAQKFLSALGRASALKDNETGMHIMRMSHYARIIGEIMGLDEDQVRFLFQAAPMHDVGKIGIPDNILLKPDRLTNDEFTIIKQHPQFGVDIIEEYDDELIVAARRIILAHHEKWDGTGYPNGLQGEQIPLFGRITAVADVYDALTSDRPYKPAWPPSKAILTIWEDTGTHFDPNVVEAFKSGLDAILEIQERFKD